MPVLKKDSPASPFSLAYFFLFIIIYAVEENYMQTSKFYNESTRQVQRYTNKIKD